MKKRKNIVLTALALALIFTAGIGSAQAYFTTYAKAQGGVQLALGGRRELTEEFSDWTKTLTVTNNADSAEPIYVRARVYAPERLYLGTDRAEVPLTCEIIGDGWSGPYGDYFYYTRPVAPGEGTTELRVHIQGIPAKDDPLYAELQEGDQFNVVVTYESIPVTYTPEGEPVDPMTADWDRQLDSGTTEGGLEP